MRVALIGSVSSSWHAVRGLLDGGVEVCGVLGLAPAHAAGVSDYRDLAPLAAEHDLPYCPFHKVTDPEVAAFLDRQTPDLLLVIGLSQIVPDDLLARTPHGGIGFHPTLLPEGRGRAPVAWTILLNQPAAVNLFYLTADADAGDLIAQVPVPVQPDDTAQSLITRTNEVLEGTLASLGPALRKGKLPRIPQDPRRATWYGARRPEDGRIDWREPAMQIDRLVRAAGHPYPGAFTHDRGQKRIIWRSEIVPGGRWHGTLGQVLEVDPVRGVLVQCGSGHLRLIEVSGPDGHPVPRDAFRVGVRLGHAVEAELEQLAARVADLESELARLREGHA